MNFEKSIKWFLQRVIFAMKDFCNGSVNFAMINERFLQRVTRHVPEDERPILQQVACKIWINSV